MSKETIGDNLEFKSNFAGKRVTVFTTEKDLRDNVVLAASAQDIMCERANESLFRTRFSLGIWKDYISGVSELPRFSKLLLNLCEAPIAFVRPRKDGYLDCHIYIDQVIRLVQSGKSVGNFKVPKGLPEEARQIALVQAIDKVWNHERQHIIQRMDDKNKKAMDRDSKIVQRVTNIALGTIATATPITAYCMQIKTPESSLLVLIGAGSIITSGLIVIGVQHYKHFSYYEKEAYQAMKRDDKIPSPFLVTFN